MPSKPSFFGKLIRRSKNNKAVGDHLAPPVDSGDEVSLRSSRASSRASPIPSIVSEPAENDISTENIVEPVVSLPSTRPVSLWPRAYDQVRKDDADLVEEYEKLLCEHPSNSSDANPLPHDTAEKMALLTKQGMEDLTASRLKYKLFGNEFVLLDQAGQLSSTLVGFKDYVADVLKASPEALMAWAGVALVLPLVTNISTVETEHKASFVNVVSRMKLYIGMEQLLWPKNLDLPHSSRAALEDKITALYISIIVFQMESTRRFYRNWMLRTVRDAVKYDDWTTMVKAVTDAEDAVIKDFRLVTEQAVRSDLDELVQSASQQTEILVSMSDDLKDLLGVQTKGLEYTKEIAEGVGMLAEAKSKELETVTLDIFVDVKAQFDSLDSERAGTCFENTRKTIQDQIESWAKSNKGPNILWVRGLAGTGKSTIARTMAARFAREEILAGTYFFRRGDEDRTRSANILSTIMDRTIHCIPGLARHVADALAGKDKTWLRDKGLETQFDTLFRKPLRRLLEKGKMRGFTVVIIIDALDECVDYGDLGPLIALLSGLNSEEQRFNILLTSRSAGTFESRIREFIVEGQDYTNLYLEDTEYAKETQQDISIYMSEMFRRIRQQFDIEQSPWPTQAEQELLITRATTPSPLFIYAATLYRFLTDEESLPDDQLEEWLSSVSTGANQLGEIYEPILKNAFASVGAKRHSDLQNLLYAIVLAKTPLSRQTLADLFGMKPNIVKSLLKTLHSVINLPPDANDLIEIYHKSFNDFIHSESETANAKSSHIVRVPTAHGVIASKCLTILEVGLTRDICKLRNPTTLLKDVDKSHIQSCISSSLQFASKNWAHHALEAQLDGSKMTEISDFLNKHLLHWIECGMILKDFANLVSSILALKSYVSTMKDALPDLAAFLKDAHRFLLFVHDYQKVPLQIYCSGLLFCPKSSVIKRRFKNQALALGFAVETTQVHWDSLLQTLTTLPYTDNLQYSKDGQLLLAFSLDNIQVWETVSGFERFTKEFGDDLNDAQFSADSAFIVVQTDSNDIFILDAHSGVLKQKLSGFSFLLPARQPRYVYYKIYRTHAFNGRGWDTERMHEVAIMPFASTDVGKRLVEAFESDPEIGISTGSRDSDQYYEENTGKWEDAQEWEDAERSDSQTASIRSDATGTTTDTETRHQEVTWRSINVHYECNVLSSDGKVSVSCGPHLILVSDTHTGKILVEFTTGIRHPRGVTISQDNRLLLLYASRNDPELWDLHNGIRLWSASPTPRHHGGFVDYAVFSECGTYIDMYCSRFISTLNIETLAITLRRFTANIEIEAICSTCDQSRTAALTSDSSIHIFDSSPDETAVPYVLDKDMSGVVVSVKVSSKGVLALQYGDGTIELHDVFARTARVMPTKQCMAQFSPDGNYIACYFDSGCVAVYGTDDLQCIFSSTYHGEDGLRNTIIAISPDSAFLAIARIDRFQPVTVWDLHTGDLVVSIPGTDAAPTKILFTDEFMVVVYNSANRKEDFIWRFAIDQGIISGRLLLKARAYVEEVALLPSSSQLAIIYPTSYLYNAYIVDLICLNSGTRHARIARKGLRMFDGILKFEIFPTADINVWRRADGYWNLKTNTRELISSSDDSMRLVYDEDWILSDGIRVFRLPGPHRLVKQTIGGRDSSVIYSSRNTMIFITQNNNIVKITAFGTTTLDTIAVPEQSKDSECSKDLTEDTEDGITRREVPCGLSDFFRELATREEVEHEEEPKES